MEAKQTNTLDGHELAYEEYEKDKKRYRLGSYRYKHHRLANGFGVLVRGIKGLKK